MPTHSASRLSGRDSAIRATYQTGLVGHRARSPPSPRPSRRRSARARTAAAGARGTTSMAPIIPSPCVRTLRTVRRRGPDARSPRAGRSCRRPRTDRSGGCGRRRGRPRLVRRTRSISRVKASSTCPPSRSRSATSVCASTSSGHPPPPRPRLVRSTPSVRCSTLAIASPAAASVSAGFASTSFSYSATARRGRPARGRPARARSAGRLLLLAGLLVDDGRASAAGGDR